MLFDTLRQLFYYMIQLRDYPLVYMIGIGGIGMSALARFLASQGHTIFGYDQSLSPVVLQLIKEGMRISCDEHLSSIPTAITSQPTQALIVYTPAISTNSPMLHYFRTTGYRIESRAKILGSISRQFPTLAVAGTHGKTTTTAMIAHMLYRSDIPMLAFIGGIMNQYNTNLVSNCSMDQLQVIVAEADEFNKSFLHLRPSHSIITTLDADHIDTYKTTALMEQSFLQFAKKTQQNLFIHHRVSEKLQLHKYEDQPCVTYGLHTGDITAANVHMAPGKSTFDYAEYGEIQIKNLALPISGLYNIENALVAIKVGLIYGISQERIRSSMASFPGVQRRFSIAFNNANYVLIDDYAHHPVEITALLTSVKTLYPSSTITAIYQPHLFSRTLAFDTAFASSLSLADQVILLPIYPAREAPIPGVTAQLILDKLTCKRKKIIALPMLGDALTAYATVGHHAIIMIGAGNIGESVSTIVNLLQQKIH